MSNKLPTIQKPSAFGEFQRFLTKSNAIALAIGVIIGAAAGRVVTSIVEDLINPIIGVLLGNVPLQGAKIVLSSRVVDGKTIENAIMYGNFISVIIQFILIMLVVFLIVKLIAKDLLDK